MAEFKYEITERIAILSENGKMGKGVTLSDEEIRNLREVLKAIEL